MPKLAGFCVQIAIVVGITANFNGNPLFDRDTGITQSFHFTRIVGHQANGGNTQMLQHRLTHAVIAHIGAKAKLLVCFYGVRTLILDIGLHFVQPDTTTFLSQIQNNATSGSDTERSASSSW